ncbi:hypothetical protein [Actinacidiphila glaucinigra]
MNGLDIRTALLLMAGGGATYIALLHPKVGVAFLVGIAVVGVLHQIMKP